MTMTDGEIVASYRQAAHPRKQIQILAELNNCGPDKIKAIIKEAGISLEPNRKKKGSETVEQEIIEAASVTPAPKPEEAAREMKEKTSTSALGVMLRCAAIDTIAEQLAQTNATEEAAYDFVEQVRGVLALIHTIEKEEETDTNETDTDV